MLNLKRGKGYQKSAANPLLKTLLEGRKLRAVHFRSLSSRAEKSVLFSWRVKKICHEKVTNKQNSETAAVAFQAQPRPALFARDLVTGKATGVRHILEDIVRRVAQYVDERCLANTWHSATGIKISST
ncbi:hypothetical protein TNCV_1419561 [Trichonephila clavipes]|nr:hypothetical protein TNCV_1419561 [Trichonephila clavipes]